MKFHDIYDSARPYIACFVILKRGSDIAMLQRKNTGWMDGYFGLPAGKVEYGETYEQAAIREAKEEAGVDITLDNLRFAHIAHRHGEEGFGFMDWVDVYFVADHWEGEPYNAEEHKAEKLEWINLQHVPESVVPAQRDALECIAKNSMYSEYGWKVD
jgi:8-oxo-dGTP diphosphatase